MPELPEVETVKSALAPVMVGSEIIKADIRRPDLRWPLPEGLHSALEGHQVHYVSRRAKIILMGIDDKVILWHLGMSGSMRISTHKPNSKPHDHIELTLQNKGTIYYVTFNDPRRFGYVDMMAQQDVAHSKVMTSLGPEPLPMTDAPFDFGPVLDLAYLNETLAKSQSPIKSFLLDQRQIAGLGNIYVCEALYRSGISPRRKASSVKGKRAERLLPAIQSVLREAIAQGGTSLRDHRQPDGKLGYFVQSLDVYGRDGEPCASCSAPIKQIVQSGRSSFYCSHCQR